MATFTKLTASMVIFAKLAASLVNSRPTWYISGSASGSASGSSFSNSFGNSTVSSFGGSSDSSLSAA
ncbi:hypothetical protein [Lancefieldella rimae]